MDSFEHLEISQTYWRVDISQKQRIDQRRFSKATGPAYHKIEFETVLKHSFIDFSKKFYLQNPSVDLIGQIGYTKGNIEKFASGTRSCEWNVWFDLINVCFQWFKKN